MEQERLFYIFLKPTNIVHITFVLNMPRLVAEMMEAKFKIDAMTYLTNYNLARLDQIATELIHNHCKN